MDRVYYLSSHGGGGKWITRPDQRGSALMKRHPDVKESCHIKSTQEGESEQAGGSAILDALEGHSVVYYMPNDKKAREFTEKTFNHWIDSVDEVLAEFKHEKASQKVTGNDLNTKPFLDATLYCLGAKSAANLATITVQRGYIDEPDRIDANIQNEGGVIGLLQGRFRSIPSGRLAVLGSPTTKSGRIWKYLSTCKHVFECFWPCPECEKMQTADWGSAQHDYGFKWSPVHDGDELDIEETAKSAHYVCKHCKHEILEADFRDQLHKCEWFSNTGLWFDVKASNGRGEFKAKQNNEWRITEAPAKIGIRKTRDGIGLYSLTSWVEGVRGWLEAVNYTHVNDDPDEFLKPQFNTYRGTIFEEISQQSVEPDVVLTHRLKNKLDKLPNNIERMGMEIDFQKRFCKYMVTGYSKNGKKTDILCWICKRIEGITADPDAEYWRELSEIATAKYEREDGQVLRIGRVIADAGHQPDNVIKWCSEDPDHRIGVFGRAGSVGGKERVLFDYDPDNPEKDWQSYTVGDKDYGGYGVSINPHKASSRVYSRLAKEPEEPGCFILRNTDDFNRTFAEEAVADKHSRKRRAATGEWYDHYEKEHDSDDNESHDLLKYSIIVLHVLDRYGEVVPRDLEKEVKPTKATSTSTSDIEVHVSDFFNS